MVFQLFILYYLLTYLFICIFLQGYNISSNSSFSAFNFRSWKFTEQFPPSRYMPRIQKYARTIYYIIIYEHYCLNNTFGRLYCSLVSLVQHYVQSNWSTTSTRWTKLPMYPLQCDNEFTSFNVIMTDDPRMGKTTTKTRVCASKDKSELISETHWIIKINLKDQLQTIRCLKFIKCHYQHLQLRSIIWKRNK